ncbi:orange carotenoid protein N-terminal domain-containing protein [Nostoc sp. 106C]|uniref:orange carotenoid protein N-terminal domain-containing protein n=1 Tax=Nostoc sp. 106C TaxID=1932667 RepID=UPI000A379782|nr:orange carotenoid protein N-terminal domain-containing protein [Nostoc sp. 106C]OUL22719.1 Orange carotenoid protein [Nostoc sp. RF31YmG]OUL28864.1 Orange carotenoid protein [Nostoc sp. 106C]
MTYTTNNTTREALNEFSRFDADTKLAILWYGYLDLKDQLKPDPGFSVTEPATALYDQIAAQPQEQQLQAQRDIVSGKNSAFTQAYNALASSARIEVWLLLAQGMEQGTVIQVPSNYKLPEATNSFVNRIKQLDFEERINFTRSAVVDMGTAKQEGQRV